MYSLDIEHQTENFAKGYVCNGVDINNPLLPKAVFIFEMLKNFDGTFTAYFFDRCSNYIFEHVTHTTIVDVAFQEITNWLNL